MGPRPAEGIRAEYAFLAVTAELIYLLVSRAVLPRFLDGIDLELCTTGLRIATAVLYWVLFRSLILSRAPVPLTSGRTAIIVSGLVTILAAWLISDYALPDATTRAVFAGTSVVVAIREELLFRGVLLNLIHRKFGLVTAVAASNLIFVAYHYGALSLDFPTVVEIFVIGCTYSVIYVATGSIVAVIGLHAAYDAIYSFSPMAHPLSELVGNGLQVAALLLAVVGAIQARRGSQGSDHGSSLGSRARGRESQ